MSDRGGGLTRDIILRISAKNVSTADFRAATAAVNELTAAVDAQIQAASKGIVKEKELNETLAKLGDVTKNLTGFARIIENLKGLDIQIAAQVQKVAEAKEAWEKQQATMEATGNTTKRATDRLAGLAKGYKNAEEALAGQIARQQAYRDTLQQNGLEAQNLARAEQQLTSLADQAGIVVNKLTQARDNYNKILRQTREEELKNTQAQEAATKAAQNRATAEREVAAALEAAQSRRIATDRAASQAEVAAGAQRVLAERRIQKEIEEGAVRAAEEQRAARMATVQAEVEANAKRREDANKTERAIAADRAKAAAEVAEGARRGPSATPEQMAQTRRNIEERLRLRQIEIRSEDEDERRQRIGAIARLREDVALRRQVRRQEAAEQEAEAQRKKTTQQPGFLGLRSYEITNLGYQATDVFQGALSGTSAGVIAAQQGPQIVQIFGLGMLKWAPIIVAGLGTITVAMGAFQRTLRETAAGREFGGLLTDNAQSVNYNKQQLVDLGKAARDMGISWKEGIDSIKTAVSGNIAQDRIKPLLQAAQDVHDVYGTSVPDAMKQFVTALSGSGDELVKLGSDYRLFSRDEQEYIQRQVAAGKIEEARRFTIERLSQTMRDRAEVATSPWTKALRELSKAWDDFLLTVSKTEEFKAFNTALLGLIDNLGKLALKLDELSKAGGIGHVLLGALVGPNSVVARAINQIRAVLGQGPLDYSKTSFAEEAAIQYGKGAAPETNPNLSANQKTVASWLSSHGYSPAQATAIMGNASVESSFDPAITNATGHFGLFQWDKSRQAALGSPPSTDIIKQLELMDKELSSLDPTFKSSTQNFLELTKRFRDVFERPIPQSQIGTAADAADLSKRTTAAGRFYQPAAAAPLSTTRSATAAEEPKPVSTGPTPEQTEEGRKALEQDKERFAIEHAISVEAEKQAEFARIAREINQSNKDPATAAQQIRIKQQEVELKLQEEQRVRQDKLAKEAIDQAKNITEVRAAGEKAVAEARARGVVGYRELQRIEDDAKTRESDRLNRIDQEKDRTQALITAVDNVKRALDGTYGPDVEGRIAAVRLQFKDLEEQLKKGLRDTALTDKAPIQKQLEQLPALRERSEFIARGKAYEDQAKAAIAARNDLIQSYNRLYDAGEMTLEEKNKGIEESYKKITPALNEATDSLEKWNAEARERGDVPAIQIDKTTAAIKEFRSETKYLDPFWKGLKTTIEDSVGTNLTEAFNTVAESIGKAIAKTGEWKDVLTATKTAAASFFSGILKDIAAYIIKAEALKLLQSAGLSLPGLGLGAASTVASTAGGAAATAGGAAASSGGFFSFLSGAGGSLPAAAAVVHAGGVVGTTQLPSRPVPASWFDRAPRYHTGTVVGLAANEQNSILQKGEEVITQDNPRHIRNWGGGKATPDINIRNVLVADPQLVPSHMASAAGERVILNTLTRNVATVRQLVR
jgi:hypothetical protein